MQRGVKRDERSRDILENAAATEIDWATEYSDLILSIKIVDSLLKRSPTQQLWFRTYRRDHTEDSTAAATFLAQVNAAGCTTTAQLAFLMASATDLGQKSELVPNRCRRVVPLV